MDHDAAAFYYLIIKYSTLEFSQFWTSVAALVLINKLLVDITLLDKSPKIIVAVIETFTNQFFVFSIQFLNLKKIIFKSKFYLG